MANYINWISELLFKFTNGVPLIETGWIFFWVVGLVILFGFVFVQAIEYQGHRILIPLLGVPVLFFGVLITAMGPPLHQYHQMKECELRVVQVLSEDEELLPLTVQQCRYRSNINNDFGDWIINTGH